MSTTFRTCPGCQSMILSDTDECPQCGHTFYQRRGSDVQPTTPQVRRGTTEVRVGCPHCGEMVRAGLVRCWNCNGFMKEEIAARYADLTTNPQKIIYSMIPLEDRTDYLPARAGQANDDSDGFTLADDVLSDSVQGSGFAQPATSASAPIADLSASPDRPQSTTPGGKGVIADALVSDSSSADKSAGTGDRPGAAAEKSADGASAKSGSGGTDDLFSIAMQEQREDRRRRNERQAERAKRQMLLPCKCGAWVRVTDEMAGKVVRCRQCRQPVQVPEIRRRVTEKKEESTVPKLDVTWVNDVWFHVLTPTSVVLKPGSAAAQHTEADIAITDTGVHIIAFESGEKKKKSLLSFGSSDKKQDRTAHRRQVRDQIAATGQLAALTGCDVRSIGVDDIRSLKLVQPIVKVQESMFAGVPIFGEGRIAVFLPIAREQGQQAYCSFTISGWRILAARLKELFSLELPTAENGVPEAEKSDTHSCFVNQSKVECIRNVVYYQQDSGFELELSGFRCTACGAVVSEEGRKKNKLGGANGSGIAKAKCPKCSGKMGEEKLFRLKKAAEKPAAE
ncbi:MAG: hypothetical protein ACK48Y_06965 [Planctomyces sp.]